MLRSLSRSVVGVLPKYRTLYFNNQNKLLCNVRKRDSCSPSLKTKSVSFSTNSANNFTVDHHEIISKFQGTPQLVDQLEELVDAYPGIERNPNLYKALYPFKLDSFQEECIQELLVGNNVLLSTPTGSGMFKMYII